MGVAAFLVVALLLVGGIAYYQWNRDQKRKALLTQWAFANGWTIAPRDDSWCSRWQGDPFGEGDHRKACNVVSGDWKGHPFAAFDYSYETHSSNGNGGSTTTTHHYAVTAVHLPAYLPQLQVTPENLLTRFGNAVGISPDLELESEDFNRAFRVHSRDAKFASDVLTPRTMQMLLARSRFSWRIDGADIVCWQDGRHTPATVTAAAATMLDVVAGIPSFVWKDHGYDGSTTVGGATP